jgi:hypothetical protein
VNEALARGQEVFALALADEPDGHETVGIHVEDAEHPERLSA